MKNIIAAVLFAVIIPCQALALDWKTLNEEIAFAQAIVENPEVWQARLSKFSNNPVEDWKKHLQSLGVDTPEENATFAKAFEVLGTQQNLLIPKDSVLMECRPVKEHIVFNPKTKMISLKREAEESIPVKKEIPAPVKEIPVQIPTGKNVAGYNISGYFGDQKIDKTFTLEEGDEVMKFIRFLQSVSLLQENRQPTYEEVRKQEEQALRRYLETPTSETERLRQYLEEPVDAKRFEKWKVR